MGERRGVYRDLVGNPERRPLESPRHRLEDNNKVNPQEGRCGSMDWIDLSQNVESQWANVYVVIKLRIP
jgi:hypothetical protein